MKLSTLISYRRHLEDFKVDRARGALEQAMGPVLHSVTTHQIQFYDLSDQLIADLNQVQDAISNFGLTLDAVKEAIDALISKEERGYFANSYQLYDEAMRHDPTDWILNRRLAFTDETMEYLRGRIMPHSDWHYPGMIIRPGREEWMGHLVGLDPLYIVDESWELLDVAKEKFTPEYCRRVRSYLVNEGRDEEYLAALPNEQFAFCLAYNFFHYKPFEIVKQYLTELYKKVKPGGIFAMTFNDCDRAGGVLLTERNYACYTPGGMIIALATSLGFEVHEHYELDAAVTWLELKKPGQLVSLKGGQVLSKIVARE